MADNYLEKHYDDYERRKAEWLRRKRAGKLHGPSGGQRAPEPPEDEAL